MQKLFINSLDILNFRSLKNIRLQFNEQFNLIEGCNGLGKSSILDAIRYIFFNKNSENKRMDNYKSVYDDSLPHIILKFTFDDNVHKLEVKNGKWSIDDIWYSNNEEYLKQLTKITKLDDIDELFIRCNPHLLVHIVSGRGDEKKTLKDDFVKIINLGLDNENKLENFELLVERKNQISDEIKRERLLIKNEVNSINEFKNAHDDIKNWDITDNVNIDDFTSIEQAIKDYSNIRDEIEVKLNEISENKIKINELQNITCNNNASSIKSEHLKKATWKIILLSIITLGIYPLINYLKNKSQTNINSRVSSHSETGVQYKIKELQEKNNNLEKEIKSLQNDNRYNGVDFELLVSKRSELQNHHNNLSNINSYKINYQNRLKKIEQLKKSLEELENTYTNIDNEYKKSLKKIQDYISQNFRGFDVSLFDQKGSDNFNISQNGVDLKNLNYANKNNIIHIINNFIKKGININCFSLIDQAESFNEISIKNENTQTIACKVTEDRQIKLNGKYIN